MSDDDGDGLRSISWIKATKKDFGKFPKGAQTRMLNALEIAAAGRKADIAKPMKGLGRGVFEIALPYQTNAYRTVYALPRYLGGACLPEEIEDGHQNAQA